MTDRNDDLYAAQERLKARLTRPPTPALDGMQAFIDRGEGYTEAAADEIANLIKWDLKNDRKDGAGRIRPSMLGEPCERKMQLSYEGAEQNEPEGSGKRVPYTAAGTWWHYWWQAAGLSEGFLTDVEVPVATEWGVGGSMDGIMFDDSVFELKTTGSFLFERYRKAPSVAHLLQVNAYMDGYGTGHASIVYVNRDRLTMAEHRVDRDQATIDGLKSQADRITTASTENKTLPMHEECTAGSKMRQNCQFRDECIKRFAQE